MTAPEDAAPTIREQLIDGAVRLIDDQGISDLSVRTLSTAGGRSTMCLYTKFGNRQGLLAAVHENLGDDLVERVATGDPVAALGSYARNHPHRYAFLIGVDPALFGLDPELRGALLARLVGELGEGDAARGQQRLAEVHGQVLLQGALGATQDWAGPG